MILKGVDDTTLVATKSHRCLDALSADLFTQWLIQPFLQLFVDKIHRLDLIQAKPFPWYYLKLSDTELRDA